MVDGPWPYTVAQWQCPGCVVMLAARDLPLLADAAARHLRAWHPGHELPHELAGWL